MEEHTETDMKVMNIVLFNTVSFMVGIFTGFAFCIKYKPTYLKHNQIQEEIITTQFPQYNSPQLHPERASAPPPSPLFLDHHHPTVIAENPQTEIVIRKT
jgi:uncharacterized protein YneF (UPF0154 family)